MSKIFTKQFCLFMTEQMYADVEKLSKKRMVTVSHLIRTSIREFVESELNDETKPQGDGLVNHEERKENSYD